jgi:glycosyltransferase involved in cell wall biosynthesis
MCVDLDAFPRESAWTPNKTGPFTIGYLGTCERARRVDFLFEVIAQLRSTGRDVRLRLVGDAWSPADQQWLRQTAVELGVSEAIEITGWLPSADARSRLLDCNVAVSIVPPDPLLDVASPTKLVEYLALGMPVIANHHPDQDEVLAESGAGLSAPFVVDEFAAAVARLQDDPSALTAMASHGPAYVGRHRNYETMAQDLAPIYLRLAAPRQPVQRA